MNYFSKWNTIVMPCDDLVINEQGDVFSIEEPYKLNCNKSRVFGYIDIFGFLKSYICLELFNNNKFFLLLWMVWSLKSRNKSSIALLWIFMFWSSLCWILICSISFLRLIHSIFNTLMREKNSEILV
jgi:hypothetical protein